MRKETAPKILITETITYIPAQCSENGKNQATIGYGAFTQDMYRRILARRIARRSHPTFEIHSFNELKTIITPQEQEEMRITDPKRRHEFLDEKSFELFDAEKVIIVS